MGIVFKDGPEAVFHHDGDLEVGAGAFQKMERGGGKHAIAQRPQPEDRNPAPPRKIFQDACHGSLFFDSGFIHKHHGNIVANGVDAMTLHALQAALIGFQFDRRFADGAHQDLQQFFADRHSRNIQFSSFPYVLNYAFTLT